MKSQHFESEFRAILSEIDSQLHEHLLKINFEAGYPVFKKWLLLEGHKTICGVEATWEMLLFSIFDPQTRKRLVNNYAEKIQYIFRVILVQKRF